MGWRLRLLFAWALLGCVGLFASVRMLAIAPAPDAVWGMDGRHSIRLVATDDPALAPYLGHVLLAVTGGGDDVPADEALLAPQVPRWTVDGPERRRRLTAGTRLGRALAAPDARLTFEDGPPVAFAPTGRSISGLPLVCWLLAGFGLALYLLAMVVLLAHPCLRNLVYATMALCQSADLLFFALAHAMPYGPTPEFAERTWWLPFAFDWITAAAMLNAACLHPRRLPGALPIVVAGWAAAAGLIELTRRGVLVDAWTWAQASVAVYGLVSIGLFSWSNRIRTHPFALALRRFGIVMLVGWVVLSLAVAQADTDDVSRRVVVTGPIVWYLFLGSLLLLVPFLSRSQDFMREFALLAVIATVATSLDLLFVVVFSLGQFASLALALFASLAVYSGARQWLMDRLLGASLQTTERMFEELYRTAREVEAHPERMPTLFGRLLGELFEPLEIQLIDDRPSRSQVRGGGSGMRVPMPLLEGDRRRADALSAGSLALRYARRGRRLFSEEDARLADRMVEQLRRAVRFDKAVEHGRTEERLRLAQDLHDDIGARLLTLMYKASTPEMEDYARHTLQDLKTLTRGLAASTHRLSHAAAEWKADIGQRTAVAGILLVWSATFDDDVQLTVVQWSGLTRILRELVTNTIAHAGARRMEIGFQLQGDEVLLEVADDGRGTDPSGWSHGLGLSGIRKRVMQLGGEVAWSRRSPAGILCRVRIPKFSAPRAA